MPAPGTQDLDSSIDPTGFASITGAQLLQLITGATPHADRGMALYSKDFGGVPQTPNANINTIFQRYLWLRDTGTLMVVYYWSPYVTSDINLLQWIPITVGTIPANSIGTNQILNNSVTAAKIVSVDWSQLTSIPSTFTPGGAAGGALSGNYPNPTFTPPVNSIAVNSLIVPALSPGYMMRVKTDGSVPEFAAVGALQRDMTTINGQKSTTSAAWTVANPANTDGALLVSRTITPIQTNSIFKITLNGQMGSDYAAGVQVGQAIFVAGTLLAFNYTDAAPAGQITFSNSHLEALIASPGAGVATAFMARFGGTGGAAHPATFGLTNSKSVFMVEEIFGGTINAI